MTTAAFAVSLVSLVLAGASAWYARTAARANTKLAAIETERRTEERVHRQAREAAGRRADLRVRVGQRAASVVVLRLTNVGLAAARDVRVEPVASIDQAQLPSLEGQQPSTIQAGEEASYRIFADYETSLHFQVRLSWVDDDGAHDERQDVQL